MPESNALRQEVSALFERRFGVSSESLAGLAFRERRDEVWACNSPPPSGIESDRPSGLRALRRRADGLKPTSTFLIALGDCITASRVDLDSDLLRLVLLGQRVPAPPGHTDGYVALCFRDDVVGCGKLRGGLLHGLIPTGRRRELLNALDADSRA